MEGKYITPSYWAIFQSLVWRVRTSNEIANEKIPSRNPAFFMGCYSFSSRVRRAATRHGSYRAFYE